MKAIFKNLFRVSVMLIFTSTIKAQDRKTDSTGYPGDNFSLQGALQMFKKASSPEEFEKLLNTKDNNVNNLDLNKDQKTDYIRVIDKTEKKLHAFILRVPLSEKESQDIAVIELEKTGDTSAIIQIVGDKDVYGKEMIIEPGRDTQYSSLSNYSSHKGGPSADVYEDGNTVVVVNVWCWPSVSYVYSSVYTVWVSPWRWGYYPGWWATWRPVSWYSWYPRCGVYSTGYVTASLYRVSGAHYLYTPYKTGSVSVTRQAGVAIGSNGVVAGARTTVTGPAGRTATRTTVAGAGRNGAGIIRTTGVRRW
jgi:hypothetical protein